MATETLVRLIDDLDGSEAALTLNFALEGQTWEIDLNEKHAEQLRQALQPFVDKARRTRGITSRRRASSSPGHGDHEKRTAIRNWAQENGINISDRGRIAGSIVRAYDQAQDEAQQEPKPKPARKRAPAKKAAAEAKETVDAAH
jgi:hypothetical protein